jgi:hypothetical protein
VTLAKGRPFGFLDHNLRCGDSLLGIHRLDQLTQLSMNPTGQGQLRLFGQNVEQAVREAIELRSRLREMPIRDIRDVEAMAHLDADARRRLEVPESIADAFIGEVFASGGGAALENALASLTIQAGQAIDGDREVLASMRRRSIAALDRSARRQARASAFPLAVGVSGGVRARARRLRRHRVIPPFDSASPSAILWSARVPSSMRPTRMNLGPERQTSSRVACMCERGAGHGEHSIHGRPRRRDLGVPLGS